MALSRFTFLAANPRDRRIPLRQLEELEHLREVMAASRLKGRIEINQYLTAQYKQLVDAVESCPEVLYFSGFHASEKGGIVLENAQGRSHPISTEEMISLFKEQGRKADSPNTRLFFLSSCYSDHTARKLVKFVDCAIGFNGLVADNFANEFSETLFATLFSGKPISAAFDAACEVATKHESAAEEQRTVGKLNSPRIFFRSKSGSQAFQAFTAKPLTVFVSYGGPDKAVAERISRALENIGVETFVFAHDAKAGQPLHRMMHEGVNNYDWVLLICSRNSLNRPGVLNEIEESMRRYSREGGRNILVPLAIDSYVYEEWKPRRPDLASYIRDLSIANFEEALASEQTFVAAIDKLVGDLQSQEE